VLLNLQRFIDFIYIKFFSLLARNTEYYTNFHRKCSYFVHLKIILKGVFESFRFIINVIAVCFLLSMEVQPFLYKFSVNILSESGRCS